MNSLFRKLDTVFIATGVLLLLAFLLARGWSYTQSQSAIRKFEDTRNALPLATEVSAYDEWAQNPNPDHEKLQPTDFISAGAGEFSFAVQEPDYSLWSHSRIKEYRASRLADNDDPRALLSIDQLNIRVPVYNGASELNLNRGVARIIGTGRMDEIGNLGIAGHRDGFFRGLKDIEIGEVIKLQTLKETTEYVVTSIAIVDSSEVSVLGPTMKSTITLVTCYPFYFVGHAPQRYIVKGEVR